MRRLLPLMPALLALSLAAPAAQQPPRLIVIVVADQFRADYLTAFASHWRTGVKTLLDNGAAFSRAAYPYQRRPANACGSAEVERLRLQAPVLRRGARLKS